MLELRLQEVYSAGAQCWRELCWSRDGALQRESCHYRSRTRAFVLCKSPVLEKTAPTRESNAAASRANAGVEQKVHLVKHRAREVKC